MTPVRQMANVSAPEASLLVIQPYDKSMIPAIERSIMQSDLALTPNSDGNVIRLNIPQLTAVRGHSYPSASVQSLGCSAAGTQGVACSALITALSEEHVASRA